MNFLITGRYKIKKKRPFFYLDKGWKKFFKNNKKDYKLYVTSMKLHQIKRFDCLIISGGGDIYSISKNQNDKYRDKLELKLIETFVKFNKPIILVCRGFQLIGTYYNNTLINIKYHVRVNHSIKIKKNSFLPCKRINTNSFHNYSFKKLNKFFSVIGRTKDQCIEIAKLKNKKILCTMFHPERYNQSQEKINKMIFNFLKK